MAKEVKLHDVGEGIAEGEVVRWIVREGERVEEGQPLVEVMTDKVNVEIPSPAAGTVKRILAAEGARIPVGSTLAEIEETEGAGAEAEALKPPEPRPLQAAPAARRRARELGIDLALVRGTGPGGAITVEDVHRFHESQAAAPRPAEAAEERLPMRGLRRTIAERLKESQRLTVAVTHVDEADVTELVELKEKSAPLAAERGVRLTYLPFVVKAAVQALKRYPRLNAHMDEERGEVVIKKVYHIGIAADTPEGLVVPVIRDADRKSVLQLAAEIEKLKEKARAGKLALEDLKGGTFTVTNIGSVGGIFATPVINHPEVGILGVYKIARRPAAVGSEVKVRSFMNVSLTFDHRVVDGSTAARFVNTVVKLLEHPSMLLMEG